jgi:hypothetical protein
VYSNCKTANTKQTANTGKFPAAKKNLSRVIDKVVQNLVNSSYSTSLAGIGTPPPAKYGAEKNNFKFTCNFSSPLGRG